MKVEAATVKLKHAIPAGTLVYAVCDNSPELKTRRIIALCGNVGAGDDQESWTNAEKIALALTEKEARAGK